MKAKDRFPLIVLIILLVVFASVVGSKIYYSVQSAILDHKVHEYLREYNRLEQQGHYRFIDV